MMDCATTSSPSTSAKPPPAPGWNGKRTPEPRKRGGLLHRHDRAGITGVTSTARRRGDGAYGPAVSVCVAKMPSTKSWSSTALPVTLTCCLRVPMVMRPPRS